MSTELCYLTSAAVLTALLWIPYILDVVAKNGVSAAVGYGELSMSPWAARMKKAHYNAIENLVPFAVVVLVANDIGLTSEATTMSAAVYFWARVVHAGAYTFGIPWVRTLAFAVAWAATICIAWQVLSA